MIAEPIVILDRLALGYGQQVVLRDLQLEVARGSFTALLGGNGSGKTTLLKTLAGILPPLSGQVVFPARHGRETVIGYVPQKESLDPLFLLSGFEVALMGTYGRIRPGRRLPRGERDFALQCLRLTGADAFAHQQFAHLSGGQKQRVLIARALAARPHFLLLDEPTAGIESRVVQTVMELLDVLHREHSLTILLVTHDLTMVRQYASRAILLQRGSLIHGPVEELMAPEKLATLLEMSWG